MQIRKFLKRVVAEKTANELLFKFSDVVDKQVVKKNST